MSKEPPLKFRLDATKNPKWIDVRLSGYWVPGLYSLEGEILYRSLSGFSEPRPKDLKNADVFKRAK
jgi:hypothetical protein